LPGALVRLETRERGIARSDEFGQRPPIGCSHCNVRVIDLCEIVAKGLRRGINEVEESHRILQHLFALTESNRGAQAVLRLLEATLQVSALGQCFGKFHRLKRRTGYGSDGEV